MQIRIIYNINAIYNYKSQISSVCIHSRLDRMPLINSSRIIRNNYTILIVEIEEITL